MLVFLAFISSLLLAISQSKEVVDQNGYIMYCPCMGRFGNQAEQFLGSIAFAKAMNRTIVLPPWVSYVPKMPGSYQVPFNRWFKVEPLTHYHRVITMAKFMTELANDVWPVGKRKGFCYRFREGDKGCEMKEGNPFGPFWEHSRVDFDDEVSHEDLVWSTDRTNVQQWNERFPASMFPVFAFKGSPGDFPSKPQHHAIHQYLHFSKHIEQKSDEYLVTEMKGAKYLAIHLRNGMDMTRVCAEVENNKYKTLFSSQQCTQLEGNPKLTNEMCNPPKKEIIRKVVHFIETMNLKALYVATDNDPMVKDFKKAFKKFKFPVKIYQRKYPNSEYDGPIIDIAIMSKADMFIGNCVSSFSGFVRRQRLSRNKPFSFFSIKSNQLLGHTEL